MGISHTVGFMKHRAKMGTVCTLTHYGYGVCGYGYGVGNPDLQYTCEKPYHHLHSGFGSLWNSVVYATWKFKGLNF